jgi:hypothetical protein
MQQHANATTDNGCPGGAGDLKVLPLSDRKDKAEAPYMFLAREKTDWFYKDDGKEYHGHFSVFGTAHLAKNRDDGLQKCHRSGRPTLFSLSDRKVTRDRWRAFEHIGFSTSWAHCTLEHTTSNE